MTDDRPFPVQREIHGRWGRKPACTIPWWLAEVAYEQYRQQYGSLQTLERIAERGGFGRGELLELLRTGESK